MTFKFAPTCRLATLLLAFTFLSVSAEAASASMRAASQSLVEKAEATGDHERARSLLEQAIVADPSNVAALSALASLYADAGKPKLARKYFNSALTVDPSSVSALSGAARLDIADGKHDKAQARLDLLKIICADCRETRDLTARLATPQTATPSISPQP